MKKSYNPISDVSNGKKELARRIYRSLTEVSRQLDDVRGRSQSVADLFLPCFAPLKQKLHDLCYKLIITDPLDYGKKSEELLWRKAYYDVFTTAKLLRKHNTWNSEDIVNIQGLIMSGIGHYQHFLFQLQMDFKFHFQGVTDFPLNGCFSGLQKGDFFLPLKHMDANLVNWAKEACHRCLIYLGDLNRYLLDIYPLWDSGTAERYYIQAANMNLNCGRPYNQLGTLAGNKNYNLDAVYNYMRCMIRSEPFLGSEGNLKKTLNKNAELLQLEPFLPKPASSIQKLIMRFLCFIDVWYFEKTIEDNLHNMCHEMLEELQFCLREENVTSLPLDFNESEITNITPFRDRSLERLDHITSDMLLKIVVLFFICFDKLQKNGSCQASVVAAIGLAIFSQLLQHATEKFQQFFSHYGFNVYSNGSQKSTSISSSLNLSSSPPSSSSSSRNSQTRVVDNEKLQLNNVNVKNSKENENVKRETNGNVFERNEKNLGRKNRAENISLEPRGKRMKKKCRLKRRKRVSPPGSDLHDSDPTESDISFNDSSLDEEFYSGDSESEELMTSGSEDLDETLLIIDQKIKEKKIREEKNCDDSSGGDKLAINCIEEVGLALPTSEIGSLNENAVKNGAADKEEKGNGNIFLIKGSGDKVASGEAYLDSVNLGGTSKDTDSSINSLGVRRIDAKKFLQFASQQGILRPIKLYCDWFQTNYEIVKACSKTSKTLFRKLVTFLNLIRFEEEFFSKEWFKLKEKNESIPLSEDIITNGIGMLEAGHKKLDWDYHILNRLTNIQENILRIARITEFGHTLCKMDDEGILFNKRNRTFYIVGQNEKTDDSFNDANIKRQTNNTSRRGQLMKNMGQLWLKAEVRDLESRVRRKAGNFSPYLVVDSEALIECIALVKQLVGCRQFIVIIPTVVLSHLDECKRDSGRARETIRWLESQFQHGNRSLRAQKSQERMSLPLIKYPKKKDKEAWNFFQIVECCHYFSKQSEFQSSQSNSLVTLLTGQREMSFMGDNSKKDDLGKDYSPFGIAKNFGINFEHIETFHTKWKLSTKSHG